MCCLVKSLCIFTVFIIIPTKARIFINRGTYIQEIDDSCIDMMDTVTDASACNSEEVDFPIPLLPESTQFNNAGGTSVQIPNDESLIVQESALSAEINPLFPKQKTVFGTDTRTKVQNTTQVPFRGVGQIEARCTGFAIGPKHIMTAAHCVEDYIQWNFSPARDGYFIKPYGDHDWQLFYVPDEFLERGMEFFEYDYSIIVLKQNLNTQIPHFKFNFECVSPSVTTNLNIVGYPNDKFEHTMWKTGCENVEINCDWRYFEHFCDTFNGMSGSPMFTALQLPDGNVKYVVYGIHTGAFGDKYNLAIVMKDEIQEQIKLFLRSFP